MVIGTNPAFALAMQHMPRKLVIVSMLLSALFVGSIINSAYVLTLLSLASGIALFRGLEPARAMLIVLSVILLVAGFIGTYESALVGNSSTWAFLALFVGSAYTYWAAWQKDTREWMYRRSLRIDWNKPRIIV